MQPPWKLHEPLPKKINWNTGDLITNLFIVAEYLGEKLAAFFGITTPRYQYVIDEFYRLKEQVSATLKIQKIKIL